MGGILMLPYKNKVIKGLVEIRDNTNLVLTNQHFTDDQWIQFDSKKGRFEYKDNSFLGYTLLDVVDFYEKLFKTQFGEWLATAQWYIKEK